MEFEESLTKEKSVLTMKGIFLTAVLISRKSLGQFKFYEDQNAKKGNDRWLLLAKDGDPALFYAPCSITGLHVTVAGAVQQRRQHAFYDEYSVRVVIDENVFAEVKDGFTEVLQMLKDTPDACASIAVGAGLVEKKSDFSLDETEIIIKVSNFKRDTLYFNRKVTGLTDPSINIDEAPDFFSVFPKQGKQYPRLIIPPRHYLNPMIPVVGNDALPLSADNIELPCNGRIYFELKQAAYNFDGDSGPVKQIVLVPNIVAVRVEPPIHKPPTLASVAKRRRLAF